MVLLKLGGAKVVLATVTSGDAMSATLGGLAVNGKFVILGIQPELIVDNSLLTLFEELGGPI